MPPIGNRAAALCAGLAAALPWPALAEICDKARPGWSGADGPVGQLGETVHTFMTLPGLIVIALVVASLLIRRRWLFIVTAIVTFLLASLLAASWVTTHPIQTAALADGCLAQPILPTAILAALCVLMFYCMVGPGSGQRVRR